MKPVAFDPDTSVGPAPSPCVAICALDAATDTCLGCHRTMAEIQAWPRLTDAERRVVWRRLRQVAPQSARPPGAP